MGLETMCRLDLLDADAGDRFTHMIAHELAHVQMPAAQHDAPPGTPLLPQALLEGGAELLAELTSGQVSYGHMAAWTKGKECANEQAFARDALGSDNLHLLYTGFGTPDKPGDLGYWVCYRITKAYTSTRATRSRPSPPFSTSASTPPRISSRAAAGNRRPIADATFDPRQRTRSSASQRRWNACSSTPRRKLLELRGNTDSCERRSPRRSRSDGIGKA